MEPKKKLRVGGSYCENVRIGTAILQFQEFDSWHTYNFNLIFIDNQTYIVYFSVDNTLNVDISISS